MSDPCNIWLSDGVAEYEGVLVCCEGGEFTVRVRSVRRGPPATRGMGKSLGASSLDLQRQFTNRPFLARVLGEEPGALYAVEVHSVQRSSEDSFDYLLAGRMDQLDDRQREALRRGAWAGAAALLRRDVS